MNILAGIVLVIFGLFWIVYWLAMSSMTTDTGSINELTWLAWFIVALGLIPIIFGFWLI